MVDADDVSQEVLNRLHTSPPENRENRNPQAVLLKWIYVTTYRILADLKKRGEKTISIHECLENSRFEFAAIADAQAGDPDNPLDADRRIESLHDYLRHHYPQGARYVDAFRKSPLATAKELVDLLGVGCANLYQIRRRTGQWAVRFREEYPS